MRGVTLACQTETKASKTQTGVHGSVGQTARPRLPTPNTFYSFEFLLKFIFIFETSVYYSLTTVGVGVNSQ